VYKVKSYVEVEVDDDSVGEEDAPAFNIRHFDEVIFTNHSESNIPLPNPAFLRLHATLAGVLYASGAGEDIDNIIKDLEKYGNGKGPPERIFRSGFQFLEHMNARESVKAMMGGFDRMIFVH
jgi:hypothetical protein